MVENESNDQVKGLFYEVLKTASEQLNLSLIIQKPKPQNRNIWSSKLSNGSFKGMIREVQDGLVDVSIAGFSWNLERTEAVDFTAGIYPAIISVLIKRPSKHELSFRYFYLGMDFRCKF